MKISLKWLNEFVNITEFLADPAPLAQKLTAAGLEVEGFHAQAEPFKNVVVGHLVEVGRHPNADRLTLCQVDVGGGGTRQIVCGAKNHKQGDKVVVALPGAVLPGGFAIKESKIRDVESKGMLCSESELGFKKESEGIVILPKDAKVGEPFAVHYGLDDIVMEINVTPNRADCLSHFGLAREIACLLGRPLKNVERKIKPGPAGTKSAVKLELKDAQLCPRYAGRLVKNVKVGPSPDWLKRRLEALEVNSINNVVDVTNYVMLELGQPLHAFDVTQIKGAKILVEKARADEVFESLDGTKFNLKGDELTIRDGERAVALAGIVGGKNSGVSEATRDVFVESAHFTAETVRRTMRRLGILTDSSYRFSRGTDPEGVVVALERACALLQEVAGGVVAEDFYDAYPKPVPRAAILVSLEYVSQRLGYEAKAAAFSDWLKRLGCQVKETKAGHFEVMPPAFRWDLFDKTDLVEEYARLEGYEKIPESFPALAEPPLAHASDYVHDVRMTEILASEGFHQAINFSFTSSKWSGTFLGERKKLAEFGLPTPEQGVRLRNPLNEELNEMRVSLLPSLVQNVVHNVRYGNDLGRLYEMGFVFAKSGKTEAPFGEAKRLALAAWGQKVGLWQREEARAVVYDLKSAVENLLQALGITNFQWRAVGAAPASGEAKDSGSKSPAFPAPDFIHPGQAAALFCEGRTLGIVGTLHPQWREEFKLRSDVAVAEFDLAQLLRGQPRVAKAVSHPKFPVVERDLALMVSESTAAAEIVREISKALGSSLVGIEIFDQFRGGSIPQGQRSVAIRLRLQDVSATLTDEQVQALHKKATDVAAEKFNAQVR